MLDSRKFKVLLADTIFSILAYLVVWYLMPDMADKMLTLLGLLQGVVIAYITGVAIEDAGAKINGNHISQLTKKLD